MTERDYAAELRRGLAAIKVPDNDLVAEIKQALDWSPPELRSIIIGYRSDIDVMYYRLFCFLCNELVSDWTHYRRSALMLRTGIFVQRIVNNINRYCDMFNYALDVSIWGELEGSTPGLVTIDRHNNDNFGYFRAIMGDLQEVILLDMRILAPFNPITNTNCSRADEISFEYQLLWVDLRNANKNAALFAGAASAAADAVQAGPDSPWRFMKEFYALALDNKPSLIAMARLWKIAHETHAVICNGDDCPYAAGRPMRDMLVELFPVELAIEEEKALMSCRLSDADFDEVMAELGAA